MKREVVYKAKTMPFEKTVYGSLIVHEGKTKNENVYYIAKGDVIHGLEEPWLVDPKSIRQFTGFYDKYGFRIFEGYTIQYLAEYYKIRWEGAGFKAYCIENQLKPYLSELLWERATIIESEED